MNTYFSLYQDGGTFRYYDSGIYFEHVCSFYIKFNTTYNLSHEQMIEFKQSLYKHNITNLRSILFPYKFLRYLYITESLTYYDIIKINKSRKFECTYENNTFIYSIRVDDYDEYDKYVYYDVGHYTPYRECKRIPFVNYNIASTYNILINSPLYFII